MALPEPRGLVPRVGFEELAIEAIVLAVQLDLLDQCTRHEPPEVVYPHAMVVGHLVNLDVGVLGVIATKLERRLAQSTHLAFHAEIVAALPPVSAGSALSLRDGEVAGC
jgi:hypothetical protein